MVACHGAFRPHILLIQALDPPRTGEKQTGNVSGARYGRIWHMRPDSVDNKIREQPSINLWDFDTICLSCIYGQRPTHPFKLLAAVYALQQPHAVILFISVNVAWALKSTERYGSHLRF